MYALVNGCIFTGNSQIEDHALLIDDRYIHSLIPQSELDSSIPVIDLSGKSVAPGFFDLQVNGGGDTLFNDRPSVEGIAAIFNAHKQFGTTDFLPTYITGPTDGMRHAAQAVNTCIEQRQHGVRGIHFEGPFLSQNQAGVHDLRQIRGIGEADLAVIHSVHGRTLLTLAPEVIPPSLLQQLSDTGIYVSLGHTDACYEEAMRAFDFGACCVTHLYNAMSQLQPRAPGVVGAALDSKYAWVGIIADGYHSDFASLRVAYAAKTQGKLLLVTDAMPPVGGSEKGFTLGEYAVTVSKGRCFTDHSLAGSALDMATAVRNCIQHADICIEEALRMASSYPAQCVGLAHKIGFIRPGYEANLVIFENDIRVNAIVLQGEYESFPCE